MPEEQDWLLELQHSRRPQPDTMFHVMSVTEAIVYSSVNRGWGKARGIGKERQGQRAIGVTQWEEIESHQLRKTGLQKKIVKTGEQGTEDRR